MPRAAKWFGDVMDSLMASKIPLMITTGVWYLNPKMKKIRFEGNLSGLDFQLGYAVFIRVSDTEYRNYTASYVDVEKGILELLVFLHSDAPGCRFIDAIKVGDQVHIGMPRGSRQYDASVKKQVIFGDETSLALACSFYPFLKKNIHQFQFYFELDTSNELLPGLLGLENYTIFPKGSFKMEDWVATLPILKESVWQNANFVLTGNVQSVQTFRKLLKKNNIKGRIFTKGYWMEGKEGL